MKKNFRICQAAVRELLDDDRQKRSDREHDRRPITHAERSLSPHSLPDDRPGARHSWA